jgi:hypothetical protein
MAGTTFSGATLLAFDMIASAIMLQVLNVIVKIELFIFDCLPLGPAITKKSCASLGKNQKAVVADQHNLCQNYVYDLLWM